MRSPFHPQPGPERGQSAQLASGPALRLLLKFSVDAATAAAPARCLTETGGPAHAPGRTGAGHPGGFTPEAAGLSPVCLHYRNRPHISAHGHGHMHPRLHTRLLPCACAQASLCQHQISGRRLRLPLPRKQQAAALPSAGFTLSLALLSCLPASSHSLPSQPCSLPASS